MTLPPRQPQSVSSCSTSRLPPSRASRRAGSGPARPSARVGALSITLGILALAFGACTLTSADFDPPLVDRDALMPDASLGPAGGCATVFDCSFGEVCTAGSCV